MTDTVATTKAVIGLLAAETPSGQLDELIAGVIGWDPDVPLKRWTASVDDALTLVPDGENFHIMRGRNGGCGAMVGEEFASGKTPATTLCAAALLYRLGSQQ